MKLIKLPIENFKYELTLTECEKASLEEALVRFFSFYVIKDWPNVHKLLEILKNA